MIARRRSAEEAFEKPRRSKVINFLDSNRDSDEDRETHHGGRISGTNITSKIHSRPNLKQRANDLVSIRQQLPIWSHADEIRATIRANDVLLLIGETGSGKSTQIPQFLINESWCQPRNVAIDGKPVKVGGCIAITQPRRVAAISLARRVAEEMGTSLGSSSPASQVGYSVRFDNSTGPATRIKFLTEGMLLQEMLRDPWLREYSAVIVDEVHERGINVDLVLGFLKQLLKQSNKDDGRGGVGMKVVVMSATADMEKVKDFFDFRIAEETKMNGSSNGLINGKLRHPNEDEEWSGFSDGDDVDKMPTSNTTPESHSMVAARYIKGRQYPVEIHYSPVPISDVLDAALQRIVYIHTHSPLPGDILVFLTGQEQVEALLTLVESYAKSVRKDAKLSKSIPNILTLPLYAALPTHLQQHVFESTPKFTRKIILATNIAETSITVPGVRHVIDCGKSKRRLFRPALNLDSLLTTPISRSSAKQRSGRAGRDAPGHAYRLYTEADFYKLEADTEPEILRCDLSQLVLSLKSHGVDNVGAFSLLTSPPRRALERAMVHLLQLSALVPTSGQITHLGRNMSVLPVPATLARVLLASAEPAYNCVDEIVDIVSALSVENIFLNIHYKTSDSSPLELSNANISKQSKNTHDYGDDDDDDDANPNDPRVQLRAQLTRREGDHLTLLSTVQAYVIENSNRKRWCEERGISHRAMQAVMDVRKQLTALMERHVKDTKTQNRNQGKRKRNGDFDEPGSVTREKSNGNGNENDNENVLANENGSALTTRVLKCLLTGLHPNVARLSSATTATTASATSTSSASGWGYSTLHSNQPVQIHPSSVLFGRKVEAIMYSEFVFTNRPYARCVSAVELDWVGKMVQGITQS